MILLKNKKRSIMKRKIFQIKIEGSTTCLVKCPKLDCHFVETFLCIEKKCSYVNMEKSSSKCIECTLIRKDSLIKILETGSKAQVPINDENIRIQLQEVFKTNEGPIKERREEEKEIKLTPLPKLYESVNIQGEDGFEARLSPLPKLPEERKEYQEEEKKELQTAPTRGEIWKRKSILAHKIMIEEHAYDVKQELGKKFDEIKDNKELIFLGSKPKKGKNGSN